MTLHYFSSYRWSLEVYHHSHRTLQVPLERDQIRLQIYEALSSFMYLLLRCELDSSLWLVSFGN